MPFTLAKSLAKSAIGSSRFLWTANAELAKRSPLFKPVIVHLAPREWVLGEIRNELSRPLSKHYRIMPQFMSSRMWSVVRSSIVHFGAPPGFTESKHYRGVHPSNALVLTWTHGQRSNPSPVFAQRLDQINEASNFTDRIIAISSTGQRTLVSEGIDRAKICNIPLGIDSGMFRPAMPHQRAAMRDQLGIPDDVICIGSFQKDGDGWGEGMTPKWVKGPEVFLQVIDRLRSEFRICVLLTGAIQRVCQVWA